MNRIDSGQSIWSDSKLMSVKKAKSSGLSEVAAFRGPRGGSKKREKTNYIYIFFLPPPSGRGLEGKNHSFRVSRGLEEEARKEKNN